MENELCIKCNKNPICIKKHKLCRFCYNKFYAGPSRRVHGVRHRSEIDFIKNFFKHRNWVYQPCIFYLTTGALKGEKYTPDFYDRARNVFIEVINTRQAYHENKAKYALFRKVYPGISLELRKTDGVLLLDGDGPIDWTGTYQHDAVKPVSGQPL